MEGGHHLNETPLKIDTATGHQVGRGDALRGERIGEFVDRDEGGAMKTDQSERVADVVVVRVREEHVDTGTAAESVRREGFSESSRSPASPMPATSIWKDE